MDLDDYLMDLTAVPFVRHLLDNESESRLNQWRRIQVKHLLTHKSGISKDLPGSLVFWNREAIEDQAYPTYEQFIEGVTDVQFHYDPEELNGSMKYSNLAMNMNARLVEGLNPWGDSYQDFVFFNLFDPLDMNHSFLDIGSSQEKYLTTGFSGNAVGVEPLPKVLQVGSYDGSIGLATSALDLAKIGQEFLKILFEQENKLFRTFGSEIFEPVSPYDNKFVWSYGSFWQYLASEGTLLWVGHTGTGYGERAMVLVSPETGIGFTLLFK